MTTSPSAPAPIARTGSPRPAGSTRCPGWGTAERGVPNSTGSFHLIPLDQRTPFSGDTLPTCAAAARFLDGILAIVLTRGDDDAQIRRYADTITREVTRWVSA